MLPVSKSFPQPGKIWLKERTTTLKDKETKRTRLPLCWKCFYELNFNKKFHTSVTNLLLNHVDQFPVQSSVLSLIKVKQKGSPHTKIHPRIPSPQHKKFYRFLKVILWVSVIFFVSRYIILKIKIKLMKKSKFGEQKNSSVGGAHVRVTF